MSFNRMKNQRGSTFTFVIIGVILSIGLISGIYFLKKHGEQVRQDKIIASIEQKQTNKSKVTENLVKDNTTADKKNESSSDVLPETGIDFDIVQLFGICLLTMSAANYLSSRRTLPHRL